MPLDFLKRKPPPTSLPARPNCAPAAKTGPITLPEEVVAQEFQLKLYYAGKTQRGRPDAGRARGHGRAAVDARRAGQDRDRGRRPAADRVQPGDARPSPRPSEAMQWLNAHHVHSPITRHALVVLESIDAIDLAFDTFVCSMLDGEVDTSGYPEYNAVVGGVAAHWDEATGDMICRAVVGWGGAASAATPTGSAPSSWPAC